MFYVPPFKLLTVLALSLVLFSISAAKAEDNLIEKEPTMAIQIIKSGTIDSVYPPAEWFTGTVRLDNMFTAPEPSQTSVGHVTFEPNARTAWHTHPYGQTLLITFGKGWIQCEGEERQDITAGDIVYFPPNVRHWHGATDTTAMSHFAIQESKDGSPVEWMEHVTDKDYNDQG